MDKKNICKRSPAVGIIALLFIISATCSAGVLDNEISNCTEENNNKINTLNIDDPAPFLSGQIGENGWFIDCATLYFNWNPTLVKEIWIKIATGAWQKYNTPVVICSPEGRVTVNWYWIDMDDQKHYGNFQIKIDKTPPIINLQKKINSETQITFTANVNDPASGPDRVEFYLDDVYMETYYAEPFDYEWEGQGDHTIEAIVFDKAGHSASDQANTKPRTRNYMFKGLFINKSLQNLLNIFIWSQKILLRVL